MNVAVEYSGTYANDKISIYIAIPLSMAHTHIRLGFLIFRYGITESKGMIDKVRRNG